MYADYMTIKEDTMDCYCDDTRSCDYHREAEEAYWAAYFAVPTNRYTQADLEDAYGVGHYKTGVYA